MEIKEIRQGNYVSYNVETVVYKGETSEGVSVENLKGTFTAKVHRNYIAPIPINTKWLEDLGFDHDVFAGAYYINLSPDGNIKIQCSRNDRSVRIWINGTVLELDTSFIHELQNLYHSLTGKELTLEKEESAFEKVERNMRECSRIMRKELCRRYPPEGCMEHARRRKSKKRDWGFDIGNPIPEVTKDESESERIQRQLKEMLSDAPTAAEAMERLNKSFKDLEVNNEIDDWISRKCNELKAEYKHYAQREEFKYRVRNLVHPKDYKAYEHLLDDVKPHHREMIKTCLAMGATIKGAIQAAKEAEKMSRKVSMTPHDIIRNSERFRLINSFINDKWD